MNLNRTESEFCSSDLKTAPPHPEDCIVNLDLVRDSERNALFSFVSLFIFHVCFNVYLFFIYWGPFFLSV